MKSTDRITLDQAIYYEVGASWWASWIGGERLQNLVSTYFAWKVKRKYARYEAMMNYARKNALLNPNPRSLP